MLVYDVIKNCDITQTIRIWLDVWADEEELGQREKSAEMAALFLEMLRTLTPNPSGDALVAVEYHEYGKRYIDAYRFDRVDLYDALDSIHRKEMLSYSEEDPMEMLNRINREVYRWFPASYDYEWTPWEEVLGFEVFEGNIGRMGINAVAACLVCEMSFEGYTKEIHDRWHNAIVNGESDNDESWDGDETEDENEAEDEDDDRENVSGQDGEISSPVEDDDREKRKMVLEFLQNDELMLQEFQRIYRDMECQRIREEEMQ